MRETYTLGLYSSHTLFRGMYCLLYNAHTLYTCSTHHIGMTLIAILPISCVYITLCMYIYTCLFHSALSCSYVPLLYCREGFEARREKAKMQRQQSQEHPPNLFSLLRDEDEVNHHGSVVHVVYTTHTK